MTRAEVMTVIGRCLPRGYAGGQPELYGRVRDSVAWRLSESRPAFPPVSSAVTRMVPSDRTGNITRGEIAKILALF